MYLSCEQPPKTKESVAEFDGVMKKHHTARRRRNSDVVFVAKAMGVCEKKKGLKENIERGVKDGLKKRLSKH